jgi:cation:H+ antiporter
VGLIDFTALSMWANLGFFAAGAVCVWIAGTKLANYVDRIGALTGLGQAFLGVALLGVATSLPEIATTVTGSIIGNASLVMGNLFGGIAMQVALLAVVDAVVVRGALTYAAPKPVLLFQGVMLLMLLSITLVGAAISDPIGLFGVGLTSVVVMGVYLFTVHATSNPKYLPRWRATDVADTEREPSKTTQEAPAWSGAKLYTRCALTATTILIAGWVLASTGDALAQQTGLGATFVGVVFVAISTSLPELSTTLTAARAGNYEMAISNILGTNCLSVALLLPADMAFRGGPILATTDRATLLAIAMGMVVTSVHLLGLLERRNRTVAGVGIDSIAIFILYGVSLVGIYTLR